MAETPDTPPAPSNVVDLAAARRGEASAGPSEKGPPPAHDGGADAPKEGKGGKREKKIDWGRYSYMLENFVLIYPTDTAWDRDKRKQVKIANMAHMFGADYVRMWKGSADRKTIDEEDLVFDPTLTCGPEAINLYDGLSVAPVPAKDGECDVMLELLRHLCSRCDSGVTNADDVMEWVLRWLALPFQKRGAKMATALVFHGPQGTGKNLFFDVIRDMYGKYGVMVGQTEIEEKYNGWVSAKQLAVCNEVVSRQELYHHKNRLKWMIDAPKIPIRTMHTDTRWESNWCNFVFISNENKPLVLEVGDRRHLVVYTPTPEDRGLYDRVRAFLKDGGATKFLDYLIRYPMGDFHEHTKPLMTEAKEELISLGMSPDERFMAEWLDGYLHLPLRVCSAEQLYRAFQRWCQSAGERYVPPRASFTTTAKRWAMERLERDQNGTRLPPCLSYKIVNFPNQPTASSYRSARIWIPRGSGPLNGVTEGEWALGAVEAFEADLGRFLRARDTLDDHPPPPHGSKKGGGDGSVSSGA